LVHEEGGRAMFRTAAWMMLIGIALVGAGCGEEATPPASDQETVSPDDVKREVKEAANAVKALAGDKLSQFKKYALEWQKGLDAQVEELREKADAADEDGKRWREMSDVLAEKRAVVKERLRALENSSRGTWGKARQEAEQAMEDVRLYLAEQAKKLSEELAEAEQDTEDDADDEENEGS